METLLTETFMLGQTDQFNQYSGGIILLTFKTDLYFLSDKRKI